MLKLKVGEEYDDGDDCGDTCSRDTNSYSSINANNNARIDFIPLQQNTPTSAVIIRTHKSDEAYQKNTITPTSMTR